MPSFVSHHSLSLFLHPSLKPKQSLHNKEQQTKSKPKSSSLISMAVEAKHLNLFPPQFMGNREMMNPIEARGDMFQTQMGYGLPLSATTAVAAAATTAEDLLPLYNSFVADSIHQQKPVAIKSESTLTYNNALPLPRKRSRDYSINPIISFPNSFQQQQNHQNNNNNKNSCSSSPFSFLGHDISLQIEQQQLDIDQLISQHMDKVRMEMEERRKRQARKIMEAMEERVMKKLKVKEDEIEKIGKLNWALEERVKSLCLENQIWRDLAQTNEATANALRMNLEQVLAAQVKDERAQGVGLEKAAAGDMADDAQSSCGSSWELERRTLAMEGEKGGEWKLVKDDGNRLCRNCGREEPCVLLLPCRHLCLCTVCGSNVHICPVCKSTKNASVHVNMS